MRRVFSLLAIVCFVFLLVACGSKGSHEITNTSMFPARQTGTYYPRITPSASVSMTPRATPSRTATAEPSPDATEGSIISLPADGFLNKEDTRLSFWRWQEGDDGKLVGMWNGAIVHEENLGLTRGPFSGLQNGQNINLIISTGLSSLTITGILNEDKLTLHMPTDKGSTQNVEYQKAKWSDYEQALEEMKQKHPTLESGDDQA